jgi:two-component system LytT family response regulator
MQNVFRTILVEDERPAMNRLERMLNSINESIEIIDKAYSGSEAVDKINKYKPDLIFLDIQMPELTGFEVLEHLDCLPMIIFITAYDEFALKAFETNSVDYLLKPVTKERLNQALEKLSRFSDKDYDEIALKLKNLLNNIKSDKLKRIQIKLGNKVKFLPVDDIYFLKADNKYVEVYTYENKYLINDPLSNLEKILPEDFVRIHRSVIINLKHSDEMFKVSKDLYNIKMKDNKQSILPVSRSMRSKLDF